MPNPGNYRLLPPVAHPFYGTNTKSTFNSIYNNCFRKINKFDTYDSPNTDEDVKYEPQIWVCKSDYHNIWLGENGSLRFGSANQTTTTSG